MHPEEPKREEAPAEIPGRPRFPMRINKYLAWKNYCTRREGDALIEKGMVYVNGRPAKLGEKVTERDRVEVRTREIQRRSGPRKPPPRPLRPGARRGIPPGNRPKRHF